MNVTPVTDRIVAAVLAELNGRKGFDTRTLDEEAQQDLRAELAKRVDAELTGVVERPVDGERYWTCKIGPAPAEVPPAGDAPMRESAEFTFEAMFGAPAEACFSGWGGALTGAERAVKDGGGRVVREYGGGGQAPGRFTPPSPEQRPPTVTQARAERERNTVAARPEDEYGDGSGI